MVAMTPANQCQRKKKCCDSCDLDDLRLQAYTDKLRGPARRTSSVVREPIAAI